MIKAFIFDIGGTLVKTDDVLINTIRLVLKQNNLELINKDKVINVFGKNTHTLIKTAVELSYSGVGIDEKIKKCWESFKFIFPKKVVSNFKNFPTVVNTLKLLKNKGIKLAILSGFNKVEADLILKEMGLLQFFDAIITVDDTKEPRPSPEGLLLAIKKLGFDKSGLKYCIYVGDTVADIQMAKNAKKRVVCVRTGPQNNKLLEDANPDYFVDNLSEMVVELSSELPN